MHGGSYLVARRIRMFIEPWDRDTLGDQHAVFGRVKASGAPLTGQAEFDVPDFAATAAGPWSSLPTPTSGWPRRRTTTGCGYCAGLFFISYQSDPATFVALQRRLGADDALNEHIRHVASALFACPPGVPGPCDYWGRGLLEP